MFHHRHSEAVGEIKERNPWISDTWSLGKWSLVHWQNLTTAGFMSRHSPRHVWRIDRQGWTLRFEIRYGLAPYQHESQVA